MVYDVKNNGNYKLLPDILKRVKQRNAIKSGQFIFDTYDVRMVKNLKISHTNGLVTHNYIGLY